MKINVDKMGQAELRDLLKRVEAEVINSSKPEKTLRKLAVKILGRLTK